MARKVILAVLALCVAASPAYAGCGFLGLWACHVHHHHARHHYRVRAHTKVIVKKEIVIKKRVEPKVEPKKELEPIPLPSYPPIN